MFTCFLPKVEFGAGKVNHIADYVKGMGTKAVIAIDPYMHSIGLGDRIASQLKKVFIESVIFSDIEPNPSCFKVDEMAKRAKAEQCDFVIAIGGGSAIDFGKGLAVMVNGRGSSWDYTERNDHEVLRPGSDTLPLIAIPTTSGTGSESTPFSVLNNPALKEKSTIVNERIFPRIAIVDPELMISMPSKITASTGFDAFAHALESFISLKANPFTTMVSKEAMSIVVRNLPEAVANGGNVKARENLAWASTLAGAAIAHIGVTLPHSLAQPVGGMFGVPHGDSIAACMVNVLEVSWQSDLEKFAAISTIIDPSISSLTLRQRAEKCPELVSRLLSDINLHVKFSTFGMTENDIDKATSIALTGYYFDIECHPKKVTREEIRQIYKACL
ncbi:iron-containing alcohol dehydrogenase [Paenibacillus germinis]|uniref:iron-containing alcohol dehydrogenase n=1 Tax=Paenibacillus germinis TaxID=2654979 RepID=UPI0014909FB3|nr:iron-containing alcohol dehydrogenase [Paenibacillus germinis]